MACDWLIGQLALLREHHSSIKVLWGRQRIRHAAMMAGLFLLFFLNGRSCQEKIQACLREKRVQAVRKVNIAAGPRTGLRVARGSWQGE